MKIENQNRTGSEVSNVSTDVTYTRACSYCGNNVVLGTLNGFRTRCNKCKCIVSTDVLGQEIEVKRTKLAWLKRLFVRFKRRLSRR